MAAPQRQQRTRDTRCKNQIVKTMTDDQITKTANPDDSWTLEGSP